MFLKSLTTALTFAFQPSPIIVDSDVQKNHARKIPRAGLEDDDQLPLSDLDELEVNLQH